AASDRGAVAEVLEPPALERQQRPERTAMVARAAEMGVDEPGDRCRVEDAAAAQPLRREHLADEAGERTAEPLAERDPEPLLAAPEDLGRQPIGQRPLEELLQGPEAAELERGRDAPHELDEGVIEERRAELEPGRHAGAIAVHEVLSRQVELAVAVDEAVGGALGVTRRQHGGDGGGPVEAPAGGPSARGEERGAARGGAG